MHDTFPGILGNYVHAQTVCTRPSFSCPAYKATKVSKPDSQYLIEPLRATLKQHILRTSGARELSLGLVVITSGKWAW